MSFVTNWICAKSSYSTQTPVEKRIDQFETAFRIVGIVFFILLIASVVTIALSFWDITDVEVWGSLLVATVVADFFLLGIDTYQQSLIKKENIKLIKEY